jgi:hypothetical protein
MYFPLLLLCGSWWQVSEHCRNLPLALVSLPPCAL